MRRRWILFMGFVARNGGYETAKVRDVRRTGGGRGLCRRPGKRLDEVSLGRLKTFRYQRRPVDDCSPGEGGMAQDGGTRGGMFHGKINRCRESRVTRRTKDRIAQSNRVRAGLLAIVD